jgi:hypothetical protein
MPHKRETTECLIAAGPGNWDRIEVEVTDGDKFCWLVHRGCSPQCKAWEDGQCVLLTAIAALAKTSKGGKT